MFMVCCTVNLVC